ncbi:CAAX amino terminal protease [Anopheles sinensis]|uniref:CAAX amino terminal protease n=1 Tax=Anopheles sinensis TaxID=74873 RepID=A0A084WH07_ANOSI|nr:CAAX amino terminal protease [Anopheles sinensis]
MKACSLRSISRSLTKDQKRPSADPEETPGRVTGERAVPLRTNSQVVGMLMLTWVYNCSTIKPHYFGQAPEWFGPDHDRRLGLDSRNVEVK